MTPQEKHKKLQELADLFSKAKAALAIPGGAALGQSNGLETAESVLTLNALVGGLGRAGGVYLAPLAPMQTDYSRPASLQEMSAFVDKMKAGEIKALFIQASIPSLNCPSRWVLKAR